MGMHDEKITSSRAKSDFLTTRISKVFGAQKNTKMTLELEKTVEALEKHIEFLKQNLLSLMAEHKDESVMMTQEIITIKKELDEAVQERMKLNQILLSS
jgi:flagellar basal body-associated protein FliL